MHTTEEPAAKVSKTNNRKFVDVLIGVVILVVCIVLAKNLIGQLSLKREVKAATATTNQVINAVRQNDGKRVRDMGSESFKQQFTATALSSGFVSATALTKSTPSINRTTVTNDDSGQGVNIIYKFPNKQSYYIRVVVVKPKGTDKFQVVDLSSNTSEAKLVNFKY